MEITLRFEEPTSPVKDSGTNAEKKSPVKISLDRA
jgi:hypothetical protein